MSIPFISFNLVWFLLEKEAKVPVESTRFEFVGSIPSFDFFFFFSFVLL